MRLIHAGTQTIETERLLLRRFCIDDAESMFNNWADDSEVTKYLSWSPHGSINVTKNIISSWLNQYHKLNCYNWAITLKTDSAAIGSITVVKILESSATAEVGYCLSRKHWGSGIMTEALRAVIHYLLFEINVNRIQAIHDVQNISSGKVMSKAGMQYEGVLRQYITISNCPRDVAVYSVLNQDVFNTPTVINYKQIQTTTDGEIQLVCRRMLRAVPEKNYVANYIFDIKFYKGLFNIGKLHFKVGFNKSVYYSGHIGYRVYQEYRGNSYSAKACLLIKNIAKRLGFKNVLITNNPNNIASRRTCEKIGADLIRIVDIPQQHELYQSGERKTCIYQWKL